jgi:hemolysin activation/secretion protein
MFKKPDFIFSKNGITHHLRVAQRPKRYLIRANQLFFIWGLVSVCVTTMPKPGLAQGLPPSIAPSRIEKQLEPPPPPKKPLAPITVPKREDLTPPADAEKQKFRLESLQIDGATVYPGDRLQQIYGQFLGKEVSLSDLYTIANQLTQLYRKDDYLLSRAFVSEQKIQDGVARIQVIEGYVEQVVFQGAPPEQLKRLQGFGDKIIASRPLKLGVLERYLLLANDLGGIKVSSALSPGSQIGAAILTANVIYHVADPFLVLTNRGSDQIGPLRLQAGSRFNSLLQQGEVITLAGATTPEDTSELAYAFGSLSLPIGYEGFRIDINGSYTAERPGGDLRIFDINGNTTNVSVNAIYPIIRSRQLNIYLNAGFDYTDQKVTTLFTGQEETLNNNRLRTFSAGVNIDSLDALGLTQAAMTISHGIDGLGATSTETSPNFTFLNLNFTRLQQLPEGFNLLVTGSGQISGDTLPGPKQFGLGGPIYGSAFRPDQVLGDSGYDFRVELQRPFVYRDGETVMTTQPYIFTDFGQVFRNSPISKLDKGSDTLSSAGLGLRQYFGDSFSGQLELAFPIVKPDFVSVPSPGLFFTLQAKF